MKNYNSNFKTLAFGILVLLMIQFQACDDGCEDDDNNNTCDTCMVAYKPNIYLYPKYTFRGFYRFSYWRTNSCFYTNLWEFLVG